jgi:hypothetical protein
MARRRLRGASSLIGFALGSALVGCGLISGVSDFTIDDAPAESTVGADGTTNVDAPHAPLGADADASTSTPSTDDASGDGGADVIEAGPPPKIVFVSSQRWSASLGGLVGADGHCHDLAIGAGLGDKAWVAWLSTPKSGAISRIQHAGAYALVDGTLVVQSSSELTSGTLRHAINRKEDNTETTAGADSVVWTGTAVDGSPSPGNAGSGGFCQDWLSGNNFPSAMTGSAGNSDGPWTALSNSSCSNSARLYCFEL